MTAAARFHALAFGGAVAMFLVQPPADLWWAAWLAPLPWLAIVRSGPLPGRRPWLAVWGAGFVHWLLAIHWLRLPHPATAIGWVLLSAYLALYLLLFIWRARAARGPVRLAARARRSRRLDGLRAGAGLGAGRVHVRGARSHPVALDGGHPGGRRGRRGRRRRPGDGRRRRHRRAAARLRPAAAALGGVAGRRGAAGRDRLRRVAVGDGAGARRGAVRRAPRAGIDRHRAQARP
jgi:hypothetical protein